MCDAGVATVGIGAVISGRASRFRGRAFTRMWSSAGFLAAACVALDAEDPFAHAGDAIRCAQRIGKAINASDTSCALLLPKTPPAVAAMRVRSQTKIQLGLVNAPSSCVLTGSIQEFVDCVPKTVKLPIRWPVHSSLLDEARVAVQDASELDFLDKHPHCVVLSPEDGEECSALRKDVLGTLTSQPVVWPSVLDQVQARLPDEVIFWVIPMDCWRGIRPLVVSGPTR